MSKFNFIENGSITSSLDFTASGVTAGFKRSGAADCAMIYSKRPANFAAAFTSCVFAAAPVLVDKEKVKTFLNIGKLTEDLCKHCWAMRFCEICISKCIDPDKNCINRSQKLSLCAATKQNAEKFLKKQCVIIEKQRG